MPRDLAADLASCDGLTSRRQLLALGHSPHVLRRAIEMGMLHSPRRGWVATGAAPIDAVRAIALGGQLGGGSALRSYGIWVDDDLTLTVACPPHAAPRPPTNPGERRIWMRQRFPEVSVRSWRVSVRDALLQLSPTADRSSLIASIDSALYTRRLRPTQLPQLVAALPERRHSVGRDVDARSMSGTETKVRLACVAAGLRVDIQVTLATVGTVDLLIDEWLIVEVDSKKYHDEPIQQHKDRVRDGNSVIGKYGHVRVDYSLVQYELPWCMDVIFARLAEGRP